MAWTFEKVAGPFDGATGGLAWDGSAMLFTLLEEQKIMRFEPETGSVKESRRHTHRANGIAFGPNAVLYGAQEAGRRIIAFQRDGSATQTAYQLNGRFHNQPSDLCVDVSRRIWFADGYSAKPPPGPHIFPLLDHASVLKLEVGPQREWMLSRITHDTVAPRAVLLSSDENTLYVAEGDVARTGPRELRAYPLDSSGRAGLHLVLHTFGGDHRGKHRGVEGMCLEREGNIVACAGWRTAGPGPLIYVFSPSGAVLESHALPCDLPMKCAFGGPRLDTLYVTAGDGCLYRAHTARYSGAPNRWVSA